MSSCANIDTRASASFSREDSGRRVLCLVAGGPRIGMGHVMRTLELARVLHGRGMHIVGFICNDDRHCAELIQRAGWPLWLEGAHNLPELLEKRIELVVVDRPPGSDDLALVMRSCLPKVPIAALDTFDMEATPANLVVNLLNHHPRRRRPVNEEIEYYEGVEYAIVRHEFLAAHATSRKMSDPAREIVVTFGGADPCNHTSQILDAWAVRPIPEVHLSIIVGPNFTHRSEVIHRSHAAGATVVENPPTMVPLLTNADLAVCGAGTTLLELACLGIPTIVLPQTEAERRFAELFVRKEAVQMADSSAGLEGLNAQLAQLIRDGDERSELSQRARSFVDGQGASRIADLLCGLGAPPAP